MQTKLLGLVCRSREVRPAPLFPMHFKHVPKKENETAMAGPRARPTRRTGDLCSCFGSLQHAAEEIVVVCSTNVRRTRLCPNVAHTPRQNRRTPKHGAMTSAC